MSSTRRHGRFLLLFSLASLILITGCIEKTVYPAVLITMTSVTPNPITATVTTDASGSISLTADPLSVRFSVETGVPSRIVSYSVLYETRIGEPLPELSVLDMPFDLYLPPGGETPVETTAAVEVYTVQAASLMLNSPSDIAPLRATVSFVIKDVNGNELVKEGHTQLSKPSA